MACRARPVAAEAMRHFEAPGLKPPPRCVDVRMYSMYVRMSRDHGPPYGVALAQWELVRCRVLCSNRQTDRQVVGVRARNRWYLGNPITMTSFALGQLRQFDQSAYLRLPARSDAFNGTTLHRRRDAQSTPQTG